MVEKRAWDGGYSVQKILRKTYFSLSVHDKNMNSLILRTKVLSIVGGLRFSFPSFYDDLNNIEQPSFDFVIKRTCSLDGGNVFNEPQKNFMEKYNISKSPLPRLYVGDRYTFLPLTVKEIREEKWRQLIRW